MANQTPWRVAGSLLALLAEINALHPDRDKRTDGTISGHPGYRSSHNINSAGVVCAVDITTGGYAGGISTADGQALFERLRIACRDQPRGITTYAIHYMAPPYVAIAGPKIASAPDYAWRHYGGAALHKDHGHLSVDYDILTGEAPSGLADYDLTLPWLTPSFTEMDIDMAEPADVVTALMKHPITLRDGTTADFQTFFVNLCGDVKNIPKKHDKFTDWKGDDAGRLIDIIANLGPDVRAIRTKTDKLK